MNTVVHSTHSGASWRDDFAVVGGGLCGRLVAWLLAGAGHRVALYDRGDAAGTQSAAWVAAAMLAPLAEAASAELLITELGRGIARALAAVLSPRCRNRCFSSAMARWSSGMPAIAPKRRCSSAVCASNAPAELFRDGFVSSPARKSGGGAVLGTRFPQGWLLPNEGQLDNRQVLTALAAGLAERSVDTHWNTPIDNRIPRPTRISSSIAAVSAGNRRGPRCEAFAAKWRGACARYRADAAGALAASALSARTSHRNRTIST